MLKLRLWRLLRGKKLTDVAGEVRLPAYVVSAIERGEVAPSPRWKRRFEDTYGAELAEELLGAIKPEDAIGPAAACAPMT
jgi:hypothetical protein